MNTQQSGAPHRENDPQKQPAQGGEPVQVSLPRNEEIQAGPFEHSGETARQTEEAKKEEAEQKEEE